MNQIKYLVHALLLLLLIVLTTFVISKLASTKLIDEKARVIDVVSPSQNATAANAPGKSLFQANCSSCHALDKALTCPPLRGVESRGPWTSRKMLLTWVKNPGAMIPTLPYTKELAAQYGGQVMPSFSQLNDKEIEAIFDYIKNVPSFAATAVAMN